MSQATRDAAIGCSFLQRADLDSMIGVLRELGYEVVGPTIEQEAIVYGPIHSSADLPHGWTDRQEPGKYRLEKRSDNRAFGYVVGPHSWKRYLFPPRAVVATADKVNGAWSFATPEPDSKQYAFLGVRACELAAMRIQDRVFLEGAYVDPIYESRRSRALLIAVSCGQAAPTCFCTSMKTGPKCKTGFDLALTELEDGFVVEVGSELGESIASRLPLRPAESSEVTEAAASSERAAAQISRHMDTDGLPQLLKENLRSSHWESVAARCLSCANCTMVCPTCFCSSVTDVAALSGDHVDRERTWDSCFNPDFSYMHGGVARNSIASRYRQWLTHKLSSWHDQFESSGCVGCGRCITWCPVGIDLTEEVSAIRALAEAGSPEKAALQLSLQSDSTSKPRSVS